MNYDFVLFYGLINPNVQAVVEIDCSGPDVTVSPVKERKEGKERRERLKSVDSSR